VTTAAFLACALLAGAAAQTPAPQPAAAWSPVPGFVPRTAVSVSLSRLDAGDARFSWAMRFNADIDVFDYKRGRVNFYGDYDAVFGVERRVFDLNHQNYTLDISSTYRRGRSEYFAVIHHVSRHLSDRQNDRAVAWNTIGVAAAREFGNISGPSSSHLRFDLAKVFQRTFTDYTWTAWLTAGTERALGPKLRLYGKANGGLVGVDKTVSGRDRLCGFRFESGLHLLGKAGGFDAFVAYERRIDGYPLAHQRSRWLEWGFRIGR
jgi:hypothetical protein